MIQQGFYDLDNTNEMTGHGLEACNTTPFSVKDILNLVEQDQYMGCHFER